MTRASRARVQPNNSIKNSAPVLLKWLFCRTETIAKWIMCLVVYGEVGNGLNLKTSGRSFQVFAHVSEIKSVKTYVE